MQILINTSDIRSYRQFLRIKQLPSYRITGSIAEFPDEYAELIGVEKNHNEHVNWEPAPFLFDYQRDITKIAIRKRKYAVFAECGLGKTLILLEFAQAARQQMARRHKGMLIVSPLMVIEQTLNEAQRWYGDRCEVEQVAARDLDGWLAHCGGKIGITNYEAIRPDLHRGQLGGLILDESSMLKSHYGKWGTKLIELGRGLEWKLCCTGTPAPNDRIEYANHAVFLDAFASVNTFLATYFVNRGQTGERWELKPHALRPFYRALSHWCIFLSNPAVYGWQDNSETIPPIHVHIHDVPLTKEQIRIIGRETGELFATRMGGITSRGQMGQIAKGWFKGRPVATNKPQYIADLVHGWPAESTIVWCIYNREQDMMAAALPEAHSMAGATPHEARMEMIADFKAGRVKTLISKPKILGFGLNLQIATRQVFSGLQDSYENYHQAVKRSNRIGSSRPLNVHIPVTDIERPMIDTVLTKARRVQEDTDEQERLFKAAAPIVGSGSTGNQRRNAAVWAG